jgi:hypothetical protein
MVVPAQPDPSRPASSAQPTLPSLTSKLLYKTEFKQSINSCKFHGMRKRGYSKYFIVEITLKYNVIYREYML